MLKKILQKVGIVTITIGILFPALALAGRTDNLWTTTIDPNVIKTTQLNGFNILINGIDKYMNFNTISGFSGYGFRDNGGVMEFKNSGGSWNPFGTGSGGVTSLNGFTGDISIVSSPSNYVDNSSGIQIHNERLYDLTGDYSPDHTNDIGSVFTNTTATNDIVVDIGDTKETGIKFSINDTNTSGYNFCFVSNKDDIFLGENDIADGLYLCTMDQGAAMTVYADEGQWVVRQQSGRWWWTP